MKSRTGIVIGKQDILWNYLSTFLQIGSGIILFPLILRMLSSETVGIWSIFTTIFLFVSLLDFGFSPSFTRNITYIFSGVNSLQKTGISNVSLNEDINYQLLSDTIKAMKWLFLRIAAITFLVLSTVGTFYILTILKREFNGSIQLVLISWILFCFVSTYNIYTLYYDSLIMGRGLVKRDKQIIILSQILYLLVSVVLLLLKFDLISIVVAQAVAVLCKRILSYKIFFTPALKSKLSGIKSENFKDVIKVILPNSIKLGVTSLGGILVLQASVIIGSFYVSLESLASYGITLQAVNLIASLAGIYYSTYVPKMGYLRVENDINGIRKLYIQSIVILILTFIAGGAALILFGNMILVFLKSQTFILSQSMIAVILIITFLEKNHAVAGGFLLSKNEVPFYKASLAAGFMTVAFLFVFLKIFNLGVWALIISPGIAQLVYQNWKWPLEVIKELNSKQTPLNSV